MDVLISYLLVFALALPLGWYMTQVFKGEGTLLDRVFDPLERLIYRSLRVDPSRGMTWRGLLIDRWPKTICTIAH